MRNQLLQLKDTSNTPNYTIFCEYGPCHSNKVRVDCKKVMSPVRRKFLAGTADCCSKSSTGPRLAVQFAMFAECLACSVCDFSANILSINVHEKACCGRRCLDGVDVNIPWEYLPTHHILQYTNHTDKSSLVTRNP